MLRRMRHRSALGSPLRCTARTPRLCTSAHPRRRRPSLLLLTCIHRRRRRRRASHLQGRGRVLCLPARGDSKALARAGACLRHPRRLGSRKVRLRRLRWRCISAPGGEPRQRPNAPLLSGHRRFQERALSSLRAPWTSHPRWRGSDVPRATELWWRRLRAALVCHRQRRTNEPEPLAQHGRMRVRRRSLGARAGTPDRREQHRALIRHRAHQSRRRSKPDDTRPSKTRQNGERRSCRPSAARPSSHLAPLLCMAHPHRYLSPSASGRPDRRAARLRGTPFFAHHRANDSTQAQRPGGPRARCGASRAAGLPASLRRDIFCALGSRARSSQRWRPLSQARSAAFSLLHQQTRHERRLLPRPAHLRPRSARGPHSPRASWLRASTLRRQRRRQAKRATRSPGRPRAPHSQQAKAGAPKGRPLAQRSPPPSRATVPSPRTPPDAEAGVGGAAQSARAPSALRASVVKPPSSCCNGISQQARRGAACPPPSSPTRTPSLRGPVRAAAHLAHACGAAPREAHAGRFRPRAAGASAAPSARLPCGVLRVRMGAGASVPDELKAELAAAAQAAAQAAGGAEGAGEGAPARDTPEQAAAQRALERALARAAEKALSSLPAAPSGALVEALAALEVRRNVGERRGTNWPLRDLASTPPAARVPARAARSRAQCMQGTPRSRCGHASTRVARCMSGHCAVIRARSFG